MCDFKGFGRGGGRLGGWLGKGREGKKGGGERRVGMRITLVARYHVVKATCIVHCDWFCLEKGRVLWI